MTSNVQLVPLGCSLWEIGVIMVAWIKNRGGSDYLVIGWRAMGRFPRIDGEGRGERAEGRRGVRRKSKSNSAWTERCCCISLSPMLQLSRDPASDLVLGRKCCGKWCCGKYLCG